MRPVRIFRKLSWAGALVLATLVTEHAAAQSEDRPLQKGLLKESRATTGRTDVATSGFEGVVRPEDEAKDTTELELSAGGVTAIGNTRSVAITNAGKFRLRRGDNQLSMQTAANYAKAAASRDEGMETTVGNVQGRIRYDRFLTENLAAFLATSLRHDTFQGLDVRLNIDPGFAFYFIDEKLHQFWTELGYDLQYDVRTQDAIAAARADGIVVDKTQTRHNGRAFVGYQNSINPNVSLTTGFEYLQAVPETENFRLNWDVSLSSNVGGAFSVATSFTLKYDNNPLPEVQNTDAVTAVSLVYKLL